MRAVDEALVRDLLSEQFPRWSLLPIKRVVADGWDNHSFRLGDDMVVRLPSAAAYAPQVEKEHCWLPGLGRSLSWSIPVPIAMGAPGRGFPWHWSIYRRLPGQPAAIEVAAESTTLAADVAAFLRELQAIDPSGGPAPGAHNFQRGGALRFYDAEVREAVRRLGSRIDAAAAIALWDAALDTAWMGPPTWVHGDMSLGNLLVTDGGLSGVLDFGLLAVGDPACDLAIAWTVFRGKARDAFWARLEVDPGTRRRGRAWALWKGLIVAAGMSKTNAAEWDDAKGTLDRVLEA